VGSKSYIPTRWRLAVAFALAPVVPALAFAMLFPMYEGLPDLWVRVVNTLPAVLIVGGYIPGLVLGVPAFLFLRKYVAFNLLNCTVVGAVVAALPWALLVLFPVAQEASLDGSMTVADGHLTWFGLLTGAALVALVTPFGALGGVAFWFTATLHTRSTRSSA
jgi:hypothetical protein